MASPATPILSAGPAHQTAAPHAHRQALDDLIAMGTDIARCLHTQAQAVHAPETLVTTAAAFDRVARAVRRCITLARVLNQPAPSPAPDPSRHRTAARARIIREVEDRIGRTGPAASDGPGALQDELHTRLDAPDLDDDISSRPVADIITDICRDLGLAGLPGTQPWRRRTPADLHHLHARAAAPTPAAPTLSTPRDAPPHAVLPHAAEARGRWPPPPA